MAILCEKYLAICKKIILTLPLPPPLGGMYNTFMRSQLIIILKEVLSQLDALDIVASVTPIDDPKHGDYSTNSAFHLAKKLGISPIEAAKQLQEKLAAYTEHGIASVAVAGPGFVNITLTNDVLATTLDTVITKGQQYPLSLQNKKIMVEFTDPNPFKQFHIGHLYSNIVGESLSRLFEANGAEVRRVNYQGDIGLHVAKSLWGIQQLSPEMPKEENSLQEKAAFLGKAYALGATRFEEDETVKQEIIAINKKVYANDPEVMPLYEKGKEWSLAYFEVIYKRLMGENNGKAFSRYYFESEAGPTGLEIVREYLQKGIFKESQGAIIFPGEDYGLHARVFINSLGLPTYEAKELGLAVTKYQEYMFDESIMVTGNEINEYFKVLLKALSLIRPEIAEKTKHISHGMVRLPTGKMSSRTGDVITGEWLLSEAHARALAKIEEVKAGDDVARISPEEKEQIAEAIGVGAVKYALLKQGIGKDIEFSFEESISFEGNSGPYLQYTYVRTRSILEKAGDSDISSQLPASLAQEERELMRLLMLFPEIVEDACLKLSPSHIATYLFELAQAFNVFYQKYPILKEEETKSFRLGLTKAVGVTLQQGLLLLGIDTPERM